MNTERSFLHVIVRQHLIGRLMKPLTRRFIMVTELTNAQRMLIDAIKHNDRTTDVVIARGMAQYELQRIPKLFLDSVGNHQPYDEVAGQFNKISHRVDELLTLLHCS